MGRVTWNIKVIICVILRRSEVINRNEFFIQISVCLNSKSVFIIITVTLKSSVIWYYFNFTLFSIFLLIINIYMIYHKNWNFCLIPHWILVNNLRFSLLFSRGNSSSLINLHYTRIFTLPSKRLLVISLHRKFYDAPFMNFNWWMSRRNNTTH